MAVEPTDNIKERTINMNKCNVHRTCTKKNVLKNSRNINILLESYMCVDGNIINASRMLAPEPNIPRHDTKFQSWKSVPESNRAHEISNLQNNVSPLSIIYVNKVG